MPAAKKMFSKPGVVVTVYFLLFVFAAPVVLVLYILIASEMFSEPGSTTEFTIRLAADDFYITFSENVLVPVVILLTASVSISDVGKRSQFTMVTVVIFILLLSLVTRILLSMNAASIRSEATLDQQTHEMIPSVTSYLGDVQSTMIAILLLMFGISKTVERMQ